MLTPVKLRRESVLSVCKECGHEMESGPYWGIPQKEWLHSTGTGHKRFQLYGFKTP